MLRSASQYDRKRRLALKVYQAKQKILLFGDAEMALVCLRLNDEENFFAAFPITISRALNHFQLSLKY